MKCAPPDNKPLPSERDNCAPYLVRELAALDRVRVVVALGAFAWESALRDLRGAGTRHASRRSRASATARRRGSGAGRSLGSYHVSQQNTFTGRLTRPMLDAVFARAKELATG